MPQSRVMATFDPRAYWDERHTQRYGPESVGFAGLGVPFNVSDVSRAQRTSSTREIRKARHRVAEERRARHRARERDSTSTCGRGSVRKSVTGSDFAPYAVTLAARAAFPITASVELDITSPDLPRELGPFDVVSAFDILYHIVDDRKYSQAFRNLAALVRRGGHFVFSENFMSAERHVGIHQVSRSGAEITQLLADNGFDIVRRAPVFFIMNRPIKSRSRDAVGYMARDRGCQRRSAIARISATGSAPRSIPWRSRRCDRMSTGPTTEMMVCRRRSSEGRRAIPAMFSTTGYISSLDSSPVRPCSSGG